ncbi:Uma2 family endonuclease [Spirosoma spitsbergense]|uniref:Uma2 family endonuclease n=1 Tax=Spirosoma spitsbergense TaxID=431554 RepID=UPI00036373A1|nr:Uma2 family endonuclease [Spirosoma spitsbergense]
MLAHQTKKTHQYTVEEYLVLEEKSEVRHEFYNGDVYAMAGGTVNHNLLIDNVKDLIKASVKNKGCRVFSENMKVDVREGRHISYPDVVVSCHPFDLRGNNLIIRQPRLIVEVLSRSTAHKDRGDKWRDYRKMPSLWYYMLVDQYATTIELFSRIEETDEWINTFYENPADVVVLPRLDTELSVQAIYADIEITPADDDGPIEDTV